MAAHWKLSFRLSVIVVLLTLSSIGGVSLVLGSGNGQRLDVTRLFSFEPNSTCRGEQPSQFETRSGEILNCSLDEYNASFAVDGDPNTRWQSQTGDDPLALTFTLSEVSAWACQAVLTSTVVIVIYLDNTTDQHLPHSSLD